MYTITVGVDKPDRDRLKARQTEMMKRGIKIKDINELRKTFNFVRDSLKEEIETKYGIDNINSYDQVSAYLENMSSKVAYGEVNDYINSCYQDGKWVTDQYAMNRLSALGYEFADNILAYRDAKSDAEKVNSIAENIGVDGRIHPVLTLAKTNRVNYSKPALGNIRKELLQYMVEPLNEGEVVYSIDIKNQEPGILINSLGDTELLDALKSEDGLYVTMFRWVFRPFTTMSVLFDTLPEDRIYSQKELQNNIMVSPNDYIPMKAPCLAWKLNGKTVTRVQRVCQGVTYAEDIQYPEYVMVECDDGNVYRVGVTWEEYKKGQQVTGWLNDVTVEISKQERKEFKTSFLAITYGASQMGIEKQCKLIDSKLLYKKITSLKGMARYKRQCSDAASKGITQLKTVFGTPVSTDKTRNRNELKRSLLSIPIQGTGADILDLLVEHFINESGSKFGESAPYIYFTRHDEILICVKENLISSFGEKEFEDWLRDTMEHRINNSIPFRVEIKRLDSITLEELLASKQ